MLKTNLTVLNITAAIVLLISNLAVPSHLITAASDLEIPECERLRHSGWNGRS